MSYVLHAWENPKPRCHQDAEAIVELLMEGAPRRSPRLALFSALMLARFPMSFSDGQRSAWSDSSIERPSGQGLLSFGLAPEHRQQALTHAIQMARVCDVVLNDDQSGLVHLPDGTALTHDGRTLRIKDVPQGFWCSHADYLLAACLYPVLEPRGWELIESFPGWCQFSRLGRDGVYQKLVFNRRPEAGSLSFRPNLYLNLLPDEQPELVRRWPMRLAGTSPQTVAICYSLADRLGIPLQPDGALLVLDETSLRALGHSIEKALKPLHQALDDCMDLQGLDRAVNGIVSGSSGSPREDLLALNHEMSDQSLAGALIVAHLSEAGRLDAVRAFVEHQVMRRGTAHTVGEVANRPTEDMDRALTAISSLTPAGAGRARSMH